MKNELFFNDYLGFKVNSRKTMLPENRTGSLLTGMIGAGEIPVYADCLSTGLPSRISMETMFREWAIRNKEEAVRIIAWLKAEGCRELYRKYYPFIETEDCRKIYGRFLSGIYNLSFLTFHLFLIFLHEIYGKSPRLCVYPK